MLFFSFLYTFIYPFYLTIYKKTNTKYNTNKIQNEPSMKDFDLYSNFMTNNNHTISFFSNETNEYQINPEEYKTILKIQLFFIKKEILSYLENPKVSKINLIEKYDKKNTISNQKMKNGGLFKDFDFDEIE